MSSSKTQSAGCPGSVPAAVGLVPRAQKTGRSERKSAVGLFAAIIELDVDGGGRDDAETRRAERSQSQIAIEKWREIGFQ